MCSSHGGLAIYISEKFNCSTIDLNINSQIWEGQFIEIENIESNKSLIIGNVYRPPNNTNTLYVCHGVCKQIAQMWLQLV